MGSDLADQKKRTNTYIRHTIHSFPLKAGVILFTDPRLTTIKVHCSSSSSTFLSTMILDVLGNIRFRDFSLQAFVETVGKFTITLSRMETQKQTASIHMVALLHKADEDAPGS